MLPDFYSQGHRELQDHFETRKLADRVNEVIVHNEITEEDRKFIESRDFFFLATVDERGHPQCSYKGGDPGLVRVVDKNTVAFPSYDGNGMFLSMGNMRTTGHVAMLFIDFENPHRFRLNGSASIRLDDELLAEYHEAQLIVRVKVREMFINCPRYIHRLKKVEHSIYVPKTTCETPLPDWKKLDVVQDVLPEADRRKVKAQQTG